MVNSTRKGAVATRPRKTTAPAATSGGVNTPAVDPATHGSDNATANSPQELLRRVFGFDRFREGQLPVMERLLAGRNALSIFPTGGGKSLCYELPALIFGGLTLVISPLIALMKDQIGFLKAHNVPAARLDSSLTRDEVQRVHNDLASQRLKLLYIAPERLGNERFLHRLERSRIALLAIDEAHCISEWGHNFRPDYLKLPRLAKQLGVERVLTLTATATPEVAHDIARAFDIAADDIVHTGFYRPNLTLEVTPCPANERQQTLLARVRERPPGPTVVYVTLQRTAEDVAQYLSGAGCTARAYHAGMEADARNSVQDAFMASDEMIVVATIAFGMGVDKANIRYVYHYNLPKSLESYMQEIGRAGRDGAASTCELFACSDDIVTLENFSYGDTPTPAAVGALLDELLGLGEEFDVSVYDLSQRHDVRPLVVQTLLAYLELEEVIQATGPFYTGFKFQPQRPSDVMLRDFDPERAAFLRSIFGQAHKGRTWFSLDADAVSKQLGHSRERIVKALGFLEERGDLVLQASGLRLGYRRRAEIRDRDTLKNTLTGRFARREEQDVARIRRVCDWAAAEGCLTQALLAYFGEDREACGHCARCAGRAAQPLPAPRRPALGKREAAKVQALRAEGHAALATPRQLARFLCGLTSPATTRARLRNHADFGRLAATPFADVLKFVEQRADT
jgi:ATP-dependent DNA helicase RecQ